MRTCRVCLCVSAFAVCVIACGAVYVCVCVLACGVVRVCLCGVYERECV